MKAFVSKRGRRESNRWSVSSVILLIHKPFLLGVALYEKALHDTSNRKTRPLADFNHSPRNQHDTTGQRFPSGGTLVKMFPFHTRIDIFVCRKYKFVLTSERFARRNLRNIDVSTYFRNRFSFLLYSVYYNANMSVFDLLINTNIQEYIVIYILIY